MTKKVLTTIAVCIAMMCAAFAFPLTASAEEDTYPALTISSASEWNALAERVAAGEDFFGSVITLTSGVSGEITPLGSKETPFRGTLDGGGHTIYASISGGDYTAPVGYLSGGEVRRLGVQGDMSGAQAVGGVVGFNDRGRVEECYHFGNVSADNYAGGVVGENRGEIANCYHIGSVSANGEGRFAGGIAATNDYDGKITGCYASASVGGDLCGGAVGYAGRGSILTCYYNKELCGRPYFEAGNAVLDITPVTGEELCSTSPSSAFSVYEGEREGWLAYPRLNGVRGRENLLVEWDDHLVGSDLIALVNGGEKTVAARQGATLPSVQKAGYSFLGWFTAAEGGEQVTSAEGSGDICLYSRFELIVYTVTFNLGEGAFKQGFSPVLTYTAESGLTLPGEDDLVNEGMNFAGWTDGEGNEVLSIPAGSTGDITLTARWSPAAITVITDVSGKYFWVIIDAALALVLIAECALIARTKKRRAQAYAFAPFSAGMFFYPGGFILACAELALILLLPLTLLRRRHASAVAAERADDPYEFLREHLPRDEAYDDLGEYEEGEESREQTEYEECEYGEESEYGEERECGEEREEIYPLSSPARRLALPYFEPLGGVESIDSHMRFRNSFTARLAMSGGKAKELYRAFKEYALSFGRVKSRISWSGESFRAGRHRLVFLTVAGNTLRICFALAPSAVPARYKAADKSGVKRYAATPAMIKVRSKRALRRAKELFDMTAASFGVTRAEAGEIVLDNEDVLSGKYAGREELLGGGFIRSDITFSSPEEDGFIRNQDKRNSA